METAFLAPTIPEGSIGTQTKRRKSIFPRKKLFLSRYSSSAWVTIWNWKGR